MQNESKENPQTAGSHAGVRSNSSEYHDGANVTDQLGNDEQNQNFGAFESGFDDEVENEEE